MSRAKRLLRDGATLLLGDGGARVLAFLAALLLADRLGVHAFGVAYIGLTALSYALWGSDLGLAILGTREMAKPPRDRAIGFGDILSLRMALGLLGTLVTAIVVAATIEDETTRTVALLFLIALPPTLLQIEWYYQGVARYGPIAAIRYLFGGGYLLGIFLLVDGPDDLLRVPLIYAASVGLAATAALLLRRPEEPAVSIVSTEKRLLLARWKSALARATPIGIGSAAAQSLQIVPPIIIAAMVGEEGVGIFGAAFRLVLALTVVDRLFIALFLPLITRTRSTAPEEFPRLLRRIVVPLLIGSALLCAAISLLAGPIIDLVYDPEYAPAAAPLAVMSWFLFGTIMTSFFTYALIAVDVERAYLRASLISAVIAVALVLLLTWRYGTLGAAIGLTVGELLTTVLVWREYRKRMGSSTGALPLLSSGGGAVRGCLMLRHPFAPSLHR